jgi:glycerol-3-phosphate dehydrogenase
MRMRNTVALLVAFGVSAGCEGSSGTANLETDDQKASYSIGFDVGSSLGPLSDAVDRAAFNKGLEDGLAGLDGDLTPEEIQTVMTAFGERMQTAQADAQALVATENQESGEETDFHHLFSKGIHLIVDRITDSQRVMAFFASDGRLFFLIPMGPKTCIGTTDTQVDNPAVEVTDEDRDFVLENANALLDLDPPLTRDSIIAERVGVRPLAIKGEGGEADWVQLSRKHVIEVDEPTRHLSIFGGKLTDCLNVGDEVAQWIERLGIDVPESDNIWYGEPGTELRDEFMLQAKLMDLDALTDPSSSEPLSERFWRRYGESAFGLLERIREDESCVDLLLENAEYTRVEIELAARREMIVKLEDFMRRRSKIEQVVRWEDIQKAPGLREACDILFGSEAQARLAEYLARSS